MMVGAKSFSSLWFEKERVSRVSEVVLVGGWVCEKS